MNIVVFNAGSSTLKTSVFRIDKGVISEEPVEPLFKKTLELNSTAAGAFRDAASSLIDGSFEGTLDAKEVDAIGHRVVHGGPEYREATLLTDDLIESIELFSDLAPSHNPAALEVIAASRRLFKEETPQVVLLDTAFHSTLPPERKVYPLPYEWYENLGIRRYGFHGVSHSYCAQRAEHLVHQLATEDKDGTLRTVTCHLGNGCSLAAVKGGICVDTTMGFTPLDGLMMGTRCGGLDPGILIHVQKTTSFSLDELDTILNKHSGLLGVSGVSSDMRGVMQASFAGDRRATLAINMFVHRLKSGIAAMASSMGGLDALVFTAGVGENSSFIRQRTLTGMEYLGVELDEEANEKIKPDGLISSEKSRVKVFVIKTREDWEIAKQSARLLKDK